MRKKDTIKNKLKSFFNLDGKILQFLNPLKFLLGKLLNVSSNDVRRLWKFCSKSTMEMPGKSY